MRMLLASWPVETSVFDSVDTFVQRLDDIASTVVLHHKLFAQLIFIFSTWLVAWCRSGNL